VVLDKDPIQSEPDVEHEKTQSEIAHVQAVKTGGSGMIVVLARPFQVGCPVRPDHIDSNHTRTNPMSDAFADQDNHQGDRKMFCDFRCRTDVPVTSEKPAQGCKQ